MAGLDRDATMTADELAQLRALLAKWIQATTWSTVNATAVLADIDEDLADAETGTILAEVVATAGDDTIRTLRTTGLVNYDPAPRTIADILGPHAGTAHYGTSTPAPAPGRWPWKVPTDAAVGDLLVVDHLGRLYRHLLIDPAEAGRWVTFTGAHTPPAGWALDPLEPAAE